MKTNDDQKHHDETICTCMECARLRLMRQMAETEQQKELWSLRLETHREPEPEKEKKP